METTRVISDNSAVNGLSIGNTPLKNSGSPSNVVATGNASTLRAGTIRWRHSTRISDTLHGCQIQSA